MSKTTDMMRRGIHDAHRLRHRMGGMEPDVDDGYLAECQRCSLWLAANPDEDEPYGGVLTHECSGRVLA